ncbi:hypothetical protein EDC01DRAFT_746166, partial [Geopyxis carbonaria]
YSSRSSGRLAINLLHSIRCTSSSISSKIPCPIHPIPSISAIPFPIPIPIPPVPVSPVPISTSSPISIPNSLPTPGHSSFHLQKHPSPPLPSASLILITSSNTSRIAPTLGSTTVDILASISASIRATPCHSCGRRCVASIFSATSITASAVPGCSMRGGRRDGPGAGVGRKSGAWVACGNGSRGGGSASGGGGGRHGRSSGVKRGVGGGGGRGGDGMLCNCAASGTQCNCAGDGDGGDSAKCGTLERSSSDSDGSDGPARVGVVSGVWSWVFLRCSSIRRFGEGVLGHDGLGGRPRLGVGLGAGCNAGFGAGLGLVTRKACMSGRLRQPSMARTVGRSRGGSDIVSEESEVVVGVVG